MNAEDFTKQLRERIAGILKDAEDFVFEVEKRIEERENQLNDAIKRYEGLKEKEKTLQERDTALDERQKEVYKQMEANRDKQKALELKEQELEDKIKRVQSILH